MSEDKETEMVGVFSGVLSKHGPLTLAFVLMCAAFYFFTLKPQAADRTVLIDTLRSNVVNQEEALSSMAQFSGEIANSVHRQEIFLQNLSTTMGQFTSEVRQVHPVQNLKLDELIDITEDIRDSVE